MRLIATLVSILVAQAVASAQTGGSGPPAAPASAPTSAPAGAATSQPDEATQKLIVQLQTAWAQPRSVVAKVTVAGTLTSGTPNGTLTIQTQATGTCTVVCKDGVVRLRQELQRAVLRKTGEQELREERHVTIVDDGRVAVTLMDQGSQPAIAVRRLSPVEEPAIVPALLRMLASQSVLHRLPDDTVGGEPAVLIDAPPRVAGSGRPRRVYAFSGKDGTLLRVQSFDHAGETLETITYAELKRDAQVPADAFTLKVPDGVPVMDLTGATRPTSRPTVMPPPVHANPPPAAPTPPAGH